MTNIRMKTVILLLGLILAFLIVPVSAENTKIMNNSTYGLTNVTTSPITMASTTKTYTITPNTKPCSNKVLRYTTYNKYTKNYYALFTYMQKLEKYGGGTLILKKGTYTISNSVPIPSNVNLILEDGVVINKGTQTGTKKFKASISMFQLAQPSKYKKSGAYSKYNGVHNVNIIGNGTAVINLRYIKGNIAIVCGHNRNIRIQGITFKNLNSGHFIELDATNGMKISNCKFTSSKASAKLNAEAINLDTPDRNTKGFNAIWTSYDKTPNYNIVIENNVFTGLDRAIGTHKYSQIKTNGKYVVNKGQIYHTKIIIRNNKITSTRCDAIRILNWKDSQIINNYIADVRKNSNNYRAVCASGAVNLTVKYNYFNNMNRPIEILPAKNTGTGWMYSITYNKIIPTNIADIKHNFCVSVVDNFARITYKYKDYSNTRKIYLIT